MPPSSIKLRKPVYIDEPKSVIYEGEMVEASCFGGLEIQALLEQKAGLKNNDLVRLWNAYNDLKAIFCGNNGPKLRHSGEPYYQHPKAVMLILLLELGIKNPETLISALHHDSPEDSLLVRGNQNHERKDITLVQNEITTFDALAQRYNEKIAKILLALRKKGKKPRNGTTKEYQDFLYQYCNDLLNQFPEIRIQATRVKTADRIQNLRSLPVDGTKKNGESAEDFNARTLIDSHNFVLPIARIAGERFYELLRNEIDDKLDILTLQQRADLKEVHFELLYNIGYIKRAIIQTLVPENIQSAMVDARKCATTATQKTLSKPNKAKFKVPFLS